MYANYVLNESMGWSGGAHQVLLMAGAFAGEARCKARLPAGSEILARAEAAGVPVERVRMRQDYDVPAAWEVARLLKERGVELLHAQHSTAHAIGLMAARGRACPRSPSRGGSFFRSSATCSAGSNTSPNASTVMSRFRRRSGLS